MMLAPELLPVVDVWSLIVMVDPAMRRLENASRYSQPRRPPFPCLTRQKRINGVKRA